MGAGIANEGATSTAINCIIWGNTGGSIYNTSGGNANITYSIVAGGYTGTSNSNRDPLFINTASPIGSDNTWGTADDGLAMLACSPAINAGQNSANTTTTDLTIDLGVYEYQGSSGSITVSIAATPSLTIASGGSVTLTASGATSYTWSNGVQSSSVVLTNLTSATTLSVSGTTGTCQATASAAVSVTNGAGVNNVSTVLLQAGNCPGRLTFTGSGTRFTLSGPAGFSMNLPLRPPGASGTALSFGGIRQPGAYTLTAYDSAGNATPTTVTITGTGCP